MKRTTNLPHTPNRPGENARAESILLWTGHITALILFFVSLVSYVTLQTLTHSLLDPGVYTDVFAKNRVYDRVYEEILADPAIQERVNGLLERFGVSPTTSERVSSFAVSTLYLVLPPPELKQALDKVAVEITEYLKGNRDRIDSSVGIKSILTDERFQNRLLTTLQTRIAEQAYVTDLYADVRVVLDWRLGSENGAYFETLLSELRRFSNGLANSRLEQIPVGLFTLQPDQLTEEQQDAILDALFSPLGDAASPETVAQVRAALSQQDIPGAIALASQQLVRPVVEQVLADLLDDLDEDTLDLLSLYSSVMDHTQQNIFARINSARTALHQIRAHLYPVTVLLMMVSLGILALTRVRLRQKIQGICAVLILAGATILVGWVILLVGVQFDIGFESEVIEVPLSIQDLVHDVLGGVVDEIRLSVFLQAMYLLVAGLLLLALCYNQQFWRWLLRTQFTPEQISRRVVGSVFVLTMVPVLVGVVVNRNGAPTLRCNGSADLCERRLDEVTFAATHNAMSISSQGWIFPRQDGTLTDQLDAGIRAFLMDVYYFNTGEELRRLALESPPETQEAILGVIDELHLDRELQREGTWLCHDVCLLGSTRFVDALSEIRAFMRTHPNEVILLLLQDRVTNADAAQAFADSGLVDYVYRGDLDDEMPTLAELIALNQRVIVMAEESGPPPDWYHHMWDLTEETPFRVSRIEDLSCQPNRGGTGRPLFLLNHWITKTSPSRVDAVRVNSYDFMLDRARTCAEERDKIPNIIAVDFYNLSDVVAVVDAINAGALD